MRAFSLLYSGDIGGSLSDTLVFRVDGSGGGEWYLELSPKASTSGEGAAANPGLVIHLRETADMPPISPRISCIGNLDILALCRGGNNLLCRIGHLYRETRTYFTASGRAGLFLLGLTIFFFEARAVGFLIYDMGAMKEQSARALISGVAGLIAGFSPLALLGRYLRIIPFDKTFTLASLLSTIGALQFGMGGVGELEKENILAPLQRNLIDLVSSGIASFQSLLLISDHSFIGVPLAGLARYIASDRTALALTLAFIMIPPLTMLAGIFSRPDPAVHTLPAGAQKRSTVAFFRKEIISQTVPVMTTFVVLVVLLHAVNISLNPLYEPPPIPVRETENADSLRIPLSDKLLQVHDELVFEAPEEEMGLVEPVVREAMEGAADLKVPLKVRLGAGPTWADAK